MAWILNSETLLFDVFSVALLLFTCFAYFKYRSLVRLFRLEAIYYCVFSGLLLLSLPFQKLISAYEAAYEQVNLTDLQILSQLATTLDGVGLALILFGVVRFTGVAIPAMKQRIDTQEKHSYALMGRLKQLKGEIDNQAVHISDLKGELSDAYITQYSQEMDESADIHLFRRLFDSAPIFCFALSETLEVDDANQYACDHLGYGFGALVSARFLDIVVPEHRRVVQSKLNELIQKKSTELEIETRLLTKTGGPISVVIVHHVFPDEQSKRLYIFCQDVSKSKELSETLEFQATHDDLTNLFNRRAFESYLTDKIKSLDKDQLPMALVYIDVDQLKVVNDTCGHVAGDQLLQQLVFILKEACSESAPFFARIGGDEFAIAIFNCDRDQATQFAESLRSAAEDFVFAWESKHFRQSISIGVALGNSEILSFKELLSAADAACYSAKEGGRNQVVVRDIETESFEDNRQSMLWVSRLQKAVSNGDFALYFQPIMRLDSPHLPYIHYEVLIQYIDENGTAVPPGNFLPSADRYGMSNMIDLWVVTEVLDFLQKNPEHTRQLQCCSINLTSHSLSSHRTRSAITQLVKSSEFPASKICFEITESSAIQNLSEAIEFISTMRELGCRFALDDFGTGFSSFAYLKNLDVDYLKIDGSFVRDIVDDPIDKAMIRAIGDVAKHMGIKTVAEYVENEMILRELKKANVDLGQGFGLAKPMPMDALHEFYHYNDNSIVTSKK